MKLVRDCLDKQLVDRNDANMGKCDGIVISVDGRNPPEVTHIEIGAVAQARRVHPRVGRWVARIAKRWGAANHDPVRLPWSKVVATGVTVTVGIDAEKSDVLVWEQWLRRNIIGRIPGARRNS